jgi:PD-(D/E)XK nuclease superfamily
MPLPNSSFHPDLPTLQVAWDSTSIKAFKTCPRMYQYSIIEGYVPKADSAHLVFGSAFHHALEHYDHARSRGEDHEEAILAAVDAGLRYTWRDDRPWMSDIPEKTRFTLIRSVVWYLDYFGKDDSIETIQLANGKPAVELSFRFETDYEVYAENQHGERIAPMNYGLCGHIDRLGNFQGDIYVVDRKTTKHALNQKFFGQFSPDVQFTLYVMAAKIIYRTQVKGLIVDGAQVLQTLSHFAREFVPRSAGREAEFYHELRELFDRAEIYAMDNHWPMNETACGNYGGCAYRKICAGDPSTRQQWLDATYARRIWDPLQARGDI